jgi:1-phosphofructokinase
VTKINEPGPTLTAAELEAMALATLNAATGAEWVAVSGSLPLGASDEFYARLLDRLRSAGGRVALDTSGPAFQLALQAGPAVVKPNTEELAEAAGRRITTLGDTMDAAERLREQGAGAVLASLGPDGAVLVDAKGAVHGEAPVATPRSAVGAGDALLAGFLSAGGQGPTALAEALAWGAAATSLPGSRMPTPEDIDRACVRLHDVIDRSRILKRS